MTTSDLDRYEGRRRGGGLFWFWLPVMLILFVGAALSVGAYFAAEPGLTIVEALAAGYGAVAGIIIGLFAGAFGLVVGLLGALIGVAAAGGALAMTLFILASPILALVLLFLLLRRRKVNECPDPGAH